MSDKTKKFRGSRTCGGGTHKNRRGAGNRGGRGNAGKCKHHAVRAFLNNDSYGKHGFSRPQTVIHTVTTANIGEIDELSEAWVTTGLATRQDDEIHINLDELGINKVLGSGSVTKKLVLTSSAFSKSAVAKLEAAGGRIVEL